MRGRRISKAGGLNGSYFYYYAPGSHQVIEVRSSVGGTVLSQQVWGFAYIDELCQTLINGDPSGDPDFNSSDPDHDPQAYYALQDANFNVTQTYDAAGDLVERYAYDPYGRRSVFTPVDGSDAFGLDPQTQATRVKVGGVDQAYPIMLFGHQGLMHDEHIDLVYNRARYFDVRLGRFISRDPLGYVDGMSLYAYYPSMHGVMDPEGLESWWFQDAYWLAKHTVMGGTHTKNMGGNFIRDVNQSYGDPAGAVHEINRALSMSDNPLKDSLYLYVDSGIRGVPQAIADGANHMTHLWDTRSCLTAPLFGACLALRP